jgi:hypothetical protein
MITHTLTAGETSLCKALSAAVYTKLHKAVTAGNMKHASSQMLEGFIRALRTPTIDSESSVPLQQLCVCDSTTAIIITATAVTRSTPFVTAMVSTDLAEATVHQLFTVHTARSVSVLCEGCASQVLSIHSHST